MDMRFEKGLGTSFLKLYCNIAFVLPLKDTRYTFQSTNGSPSLEERERRLRFIWDAVHNVNVKHIVTILYRQLVLPPNIMAERFRNLLNTTTRKSDSNKEVNQLDVTEYVAKQGVIVEG